MKNGIGSMILGMGMLAGALVPSVSHAAPSTCVQKLLDNTRLGECAGAVFQLVIHRKDNAWVSYSTGALRFNAQGHPNSGRVGQQFSDRSSSFVCGDEETDDQNFPIEQTDAHTAQINKDTGVLTIVNHRWGFTTTLSTTCDGNVIKASDAHHLYTITNQKSICVL